MPKKFAKRYIVEDRTDGVLRFYFRRRGQKKIRLHGLPGTDEFNAQYYAALNGLYEEARSGPKLAANGTFRWLCEQYFQSAEFKRLDARTRRVRRQILDSCWAEPIKPGSDKTFDDMPLPSFNAKAVRVLRDRKAEFPESANGRVKAIRQVFAWACQPDVELAASNPARDIPYFKSTGDGHHTWTIEEVERFETRHPIGTKARLALALLLYTGQRRSDIVLFGRQHVSKGWLRLTQQKNRRNKPITLEIPIMDELQRVIDGSPCGDLTFLVTEFGKGFTANGFGNWFRDRCIEAEVPGRAHGLRKAAATRLAELGASEHQIMAVTGHQTLKEVARYTKAARQKVLARSAMDLMEGPAREDEEGTKVSRKTVG